MARAIVSDKDEIIQAIHEALDNRDRIDADRHKADHEYIAFLKERHQARIELLNKFRMSFIGGLALSVLGFLIWVGKLVVENILHTGSHSG